MQEILSVLLFPRITYSEIVNVHNSVALGNLIHFGLQKSLESLLVVFPSFAVELGINVFIIICKKNYILSK